MGCLMTHPLHPCSSVGAASAKDYLATLVLSECVYKKVEMPVDDLAATIAKFTAQFPPGWVQLDVVQVSLDNIEQQ